MSYIGTLVKHCDHIKSIEQETQEEITLQSATITLQSATITLQSATMKNNNSTPHPRSGMWIPIYNYLYQKFI